MKDLVQLVLVAAFALFFCIPTAHASDTVSFADLLGEPAEGAPGCDGDWSESGERNDLTQYLCRSFNGPSDFKGVPVIIGVSGGVIQTVTSQLPFDEMSPAKSRYKSMVRHFAKKDGCSLEEHEVRTVLFKCADEDVLFTWDSGTNVPGWPVTIIYMQDYDKVEAQHNKKEKQENQGL